MPFVLTLQIANSTDSKSVENLIRDMKDLYRENHKKQLKEN